MNWFKRSLLYSVSLPERTMRSASAALGGVAKLMTDTLLPRSVRGMQFYKYFIGNTQKFMIESLGQVQREAEGGKLPDDYLARKIVGNVADVAGMFAFHFSPVWFFALVADAAGGAREYLHRVTAELEKDGAVAPGTKIESADRLLEALTKATSATASPFDAPPLSKADLAKLKEEIASGYAELYRSSRNAIPTVETLWNGLMEVRRREKLPLLKLSGAMALAATKSAGKVSGALFYEKVVRSYVDSIRAVRKDGFAEFFAREARPYVDAVTGAFSISKKTLTERLLEG